jgi:curli biogenesis system outer membrane secretion channel CsgG
MQTGFAAVLGVLLLTEPMLPPNWQTVMAQDVSSSRQQIAVVDFSYGNTRSPYYASYQNVGVSKGVSARMVDALAAEEAYVVIDPIRVQQALKALNLTESLSPADAISLGKKLNADVVLTGTITEFKAEQTCLSGDCAPETKAQVTIESSVIEVDSGNVATRRSNATLTREQSEEASPSQNLLGAEPSRGVLDEAVEKAIANLVGGLTGNPDSIEFRRDVYP